MSCFPLSVFLLFPSFSLLILSTEMKDQAWALSLSSWWTWKVSLDLCILALSLVKWGQQCPSHRVAVKSCWGACPAFPCFLPQSIAEEGRQAELDLQRARLNLKLSPVERSGLWIAAVYGGWSPERMSMVGVATTILRSPSLRTMRMARLPSDLSTDVNSVFTEYQPQLPPPTVYSLGLLPYRLRLDNPHRHSAEYNTHWLSRTLLCLHQTGWPIWSVPVLCRARR